MILADEAISGCYITLVVSFNSQPDPEEELIKLLLYAMAWLIKPFWDVSPQRERHRDGEREIEGRELAHDEHFP